MGLYVAKMFFLQSRQMKVLNYTGVVSDTKMFKHCAFQFCSYRLVAELVNELKHCFGCTNLSDRATLREFKIHN